MPLNDQLARRTDAAPPDYEDEDDESVPDDESDFQHWTGQLMAWPAGLFNGAEPSLAECRLGGISFNPRCPYCRIRASEGCAHLVAAGTTDGQSWSVPPIPRGAPRLRSEPDSEDDHLDIGDFTEDQVEEALGDLAPMLAAYEDDRLYDGPDLYKLLDGLLRMVGPEAIECSVELDAWSSETEFCYFSADASTVRTELAALYDRLQAGLDHLAEITRTDSRAL